MSEVFDLEDGSEGHEVSGEWRKKMVVVRARLA